MTSFIRDFDNFFWLILFLLHDILFPTVFLFTGRKRITFYYWHFKNFCQNNKKLSSFAQWTKKLPGIGCHGEERKLSNEICQNLSKMLSRIHRHKYLFSFLLFVFFIELCAWGKLYFGKLVWEVWTNDFSGCKFRFSNPCMVLIHSEDSYRCQ